MSLYTKLSTVRHKCYDSNRSVKILTYKTNMQEVMYMNNTFKTH
jgi:hypothetical protein